jgi:SAM-dependent methyltransferase
MNQKWDDRYKVPEFAYGKEPNLFFKEWLAKFEPGAILMPADGEGRNGVFAATLRWTVTSVDLSVEGQAKALELAQEHNVMLSYIVGDLEQLHFKTASFDAIGLIYAHFSAESKSVLHRQLDRYLRPGGVIILEAFSKRHVQFNGIDPKVGGPKDVDMLYSTEEILADFKGYEVLVLAEEEVVLREGIYHIGKGAVVRFVGRKLQRCNF